MSSIFGSGMYPAWPRPKGYYRKKSTRYTKKTYPRRLSAKTRAVALARTGGYLAGRELKHVDYSFTVDPVATTVAGSETDGANSHLAAIAQGTGESQRIGRCAYIKSLYLKLLIDLESETSVDAVSCFTITFALVQDKQSNGAQLNAEDVFGDPAVTTNDVIPFQNLQYSDRFIVHSLKTMRVDRNSAYNGTNITNGAVVQPVIMYKKFSKPMKMEHSGTGATIADVTTNSLHLITIASTNVPGVCRLRVHSRARYTD